MRLLGSEAALTILERPCRLSRDCRRSLTSIRDSQVMRTSARRVCWSLDRQRDCSTMHFDPYRPCAMAPRRYRPTRIRSSVRRRARRSRLCTCTCRRQAARRTMFVEGSDRATDRSLGTSQSDFECLQTSDQLHRPAFGCWTVCGSI